MHLHASTRWRLFVIIQGITIPQGGIMRKLLVIFTTFLILLSLAIGAMAAQRMVLVELFTNAT